jgi:hypothetical protein
MLEIFPDALGGVMETGISVPDLQMMVVLL